LLRGVRIVDLVFLTELVAF